MNVYSSFIAVSVATLLGLRITDVIAWPWWGILAPLWAPVAAIVVCLGVSEGISLLLRVFETPEQTRLRKLLMDR